MKLFVLTVALVSCSLGLVSPASAGTEFVRGDVNDDGSFDIGDAVAGLDYLFGNGVVGCLDAMDANDDGAANIADTVYTLAALFTFGPLPTAPHPACGPDPTADALGCDTFAGCSGCFPDSYEPNNTQTQCFELGTIPDSEPFPAGILTANFDAPNDEDWFCYQIVDGLGGAVEPHIVIEGIPPGMSVEIFVIWVCSNTGEQGSDSINSGGASTVEIYPSYFCSGPDDSLELQVCVQQAAGPLTCEDVTVLWGDGN